MEKSTKKKKRAVIAFAVVVCLLALGILGIYYQFMKKQQMQEAVHTPTTETEKLIARDLEKGYPETPKEVLKMFSRINQCIYNKSLKDEEISALVGQLHVLYSEELKQRNKVDKVENAIVADAEKYKKEKRKIVNYSIDSPNNYQYETIRGKEMVYLKYSYFMREGRKYSTWKQKAILVKEDDKWKILGFGPSAETKEKEKKG